jgi:hypothetical protein
MKFTTHQKDGYFRLLRTLVSSASEGTSRVGNPFHALRPPRIPLDRYVERILENTPSSISSFVVAMAFLFRIQKKCGENFVNSQTIHRLFLASVVVASKYCEDVFETNEYYSRVGGISMKEMNILELEFLLKLDFDLYVSSPEFQKVERYVHSVMVLGCEMNYQTLCSPERAIVAVN